MYLKFSGDHSYKQNKNHTAANQMISPLPDIQTLKLTPEDSFMVIACDGIWNSMSSQQVCDFVNERLDSHEKLSTIAEEVCLLITFIIIFIIENRN